MNGETSEPGLVAFISILICVDSTLIPYVVQRFSDTFDVGMVAGVIVVVFLRGFSVLSGR